MDLGMTGYQVFGLETAETGADASPADIFKFPMPVHGEIIAFGAVITEDFDAASTDAKIRLFTEPGDDGTRVDIYDLVLGSSNVPGLTRGNGDNYVLVKYPKDNQVQLAADTELDDGQVVFADLDRVADALKQNLKIVPGDNFGVEQVTAKASSAGGAYRPFVIVKVGGPDFTSARVWRELRQGEVVLD